MRVLIVNVNAYSGSTGKITKGLYDYLKQEGHEVKVAYRGALEKPINNPDFIPLISNLELKLSVFLARLTGLEGHYSFLASEKLKDLIDNFRPDVVQVYNLLGNYLRSNAFLEYLKKKNIPVVYSMVDEYAYMGKCPYPRECQKFKSICSDCPQKKEYPESWIFDTSNLLFRQKENLYQNFERIVFTGPPYICKRAKESTLLRNKTIKELYEPFNYNNSFFPRDTKDLRNKLNIEDDARVVICASGTARRKGGKYFLEAAHLLKDIHNLKLIFIGYDREDWEFPSNVIVKPFISDPDELATYMSLSDAYVCTSVGDSTPSVCLAALGCGTPIIGFDYEGVKDCAPNEFGTYVPIGDIEALAKAISSVKKKTSEVSFEIRDYAVRQFSPQSIYEKQMDIYNNLIAN